MSSPLAVSERRVAAPEVVTIGEAMIALLADDGLPLQTAQRFTRSVVGAEANVAIGLARLGHRVAFTGRVGADVHGEVVLRALRADGVDVSAVRRVPARATGLLVRDAPAGRPVSVSYHRAGSAGAALEPADLDIDAIRAARLLHVSGITAVLSDTAHAAALLAVHTARDAGVHVTFDPNVRLRLASPQRWQEIVHEFVGYADTVLVGVDELPVTGDAQSVLGRGVERVVVKHAADGAVEYDADGTCPVPARRVPLVDPVGAGDAFAAGWISGWLSGLDAAARLSRAAAVASCVVACRGDCEGLPDARTLAALQADTSDVDR